MVRECSASGSDGYISFVLAMRKTKERALLSISVMHLLFVRLEGKGLEWMNEWMKEGSKEGRKEGRTEGRKEGKKEGRKEGRKERRKEDRGEEGGRTDGREEAWNCTMQSLLKIKEEKEGKEMEWQGMGIKENARCEMFHPVLFYDKETRTIDETEQNSAHQEFS